MQVKETLLQEWIARFRAAWETGTEQKNHAAGHRRRVERAQRLLTLEGIPSLTIGELRELLKDTDAMSFWRDRERRLNKLVKADNLEHLKTALRNLIAAAEKGLSPGDITQATEAITGVGVLAISELLSYRFPDRYWTYSPNVTLPALKALGLNVKAELPRGKKGDTHVYFALQEPMDQIVSALREAGFEEADYPFADMFLWFVREEFRKHPPAFRFWEEDCQKYVKKIEHGNWHLWDELLRGLEQEFGYAFQVIPYEKRGDWLKDMWFHPKNTPRSEKDWSNQAQLWFSRDVETQTISFGLMVERPSDGEIKDEGWTIDRDGDRLIELLKNNLNFREQVNNLIARRKFLLEVYIWDLYEHKGTVGVKEKRQVGSAEEALRIIQQLPTEKQGWSFVLSRKMLCSEAVALGDKIGKHIVESYRLVWPLLLQVIPEEVRNSLEGRAVMSKVKSSGPIQESGLSISPIQSLSAYLSAHGFHFPHNLLATYYLSLQTKPFVILSGLSGTGKTKLAQLFAEFISPPVEYEVEKAVETELGPNTFKHRTKVRENRSVLIPVHPDWTDHRGLLGFHHLLTGTYHATDFLRLLLAAYVDWVQGRRQPYFVILDEMNLARVEYYFADFLSVLESRRFHWSEETVTKWEGKRVPGITIRKDIRERYGLLDGQFYQMRIEADTGEVIEKLFRLTSGGEIHLGKIADRFTGARELRTRVLVVDSAPFFLHDQPRCLLAAGNEELAEDFYNADAPHKTCIVSCDGCPFSGLVDKQHHGGEYAYEDAYKSGFNPRHFIPPRLKVPLNIYFTGTVNVDETTFTFSPKVLDRANVIEFGDVELDKYWQEADQGKRPLPADDSIVRNFTHNFTYPFTYGLKEKARREPTLEPYRKQLAILVELLKPYHLHFGYRVADEILVYLLNAYHLGDPDFSLDVAFDHAILQKILPRFHGSRARLWKPLLRLLAFCTNGLANAEERARKWENLEVERIKQEIGDAQRLPYSISKLFRMLRDLEVEGFTSFT